MTSIKEHVHRALDAPVIHSHFNKEALKLRYCPVCGVKLPIHDVDSDVETEAANKARHLALIQNDD